MNIYAVNPGRMDTLAFGIDLLGIEAIHDPGEWLRPFYIIASPDDAAAFETLLRERMEEIGDPESVYAKVNFVRNYD